MKLMAIHLDGCMDLALLTDIEREHPVEERVLYAMKAWLDKDCEASWAKVVSALRAISKNVLAVKMENEYCTTVKAKKPITTPHSYSSSAVVSPQPTTELKSVAHSLVHEEPQPGLGLASLCQSQPENVVMSSSTAFSQVTATTSSSTASLVPSFDRSATVSQDSAVGGSESDGARIREEGAQLQTRFVTVLTHTKICFIEKEAESGKFLMKFRITLTTLPLSNKYQDLYFLKREKDRIKKAKDIEEIFDILEPYWNYVDYALLEHVIEEFGTSELKEEMKKYIAELEQFEKKTTVQDYDSAVLGQLSVPAYFETVEVMQIKDPTKCTLYQVRQFKNEIVIRSTLNAYAVLRKRVSCSSVKIILAFPPEAHAELENVFDKQFTMTHGPLSVRFTSYTFHEDAASATPVKQGSEVGESSRQEEEAAPSYIRPSHTPKKRLIKEVESLRRKRETLRQKIKHLKRECEYWKNRVYVLEMEQANRQTQGSTSSGGVIAEGKKDVDIKEVHQVVPEVGKVPEVPEVPEVGLEVELAWD